MGFLNSLGLWSGLAALGVAVPIIIHLLYRKNRKETKWAAMELLRKALVVRSGQVKLEDFIVLALRCLAILFLGLALLRPTMNSDATAILGEKKVGMVIGIDASFSMLHGEHSRFEKALSQARKILETANDGDPLSLMLMSRQPNILLRRTGFQPAQALEILENAEATTYPLDLEANLERLDELVSELKTPANECYLITDSQEVDWAQLSSKAKEAFENISKKATIFVVPLQNDSEENFAITQLAYSSGSLQESGVARFSAEVKNYGRRQGDAGSIEFFLGDELITRRSVGLLQSGETRTLSFFASFDKPGDIGVKAKLTKDELSLDNERYAIASVSPGIKVLCVDGDLTTGTNDAQRNGAYYAVRALRLNNREAGKGIQVHHIAAQDLSLENLGEFDLVVMANVEDLAPEMVGRLEKFVQAGKGLIVFLGDKVQPETYNKNFNNLLPATLEEIAEVPETDLPWAFAPVNSGHSLAQVVQRLPQSVFNTARFKKLIKATPSSKSEVILSTETKLPILLSRSVGSGDVLLFTTSADRSWTELPVHPLYAMLLQQAATDLTSDTSSQHLIAGTPVELLVPERQVGSDIQVLDPTGQAQALKVTQVGENPSCPIDAASIGIYKIEGGDKFKSLQVAVNPDQRESMSSSLDASSLQSQLEPLGIRAISDTGTLIEAIENSRRGRELAHLLLVLSTAAFILQALLAKRFTDKMRQGEASDLGGALQINQVQAARRS